MSKTSSGSSCLKQNLERELMFGAKPRAGAHVWSKTSSGISCLEPNLKREHMFGAKPRAGAHVWSKTSSGSSCLKQNLELEHFRNMHAKHVKPRKPDRRPRRLRSSKGNFKINLHICTSFRCVSESTGVFIEITLEGIVWGPDMDQSSP